MKFYFLGIRWYYALILLPACGFLCEQLPEYETGIIIATVIIWIGLIIHRVKNDE